MDVTIALRHPFPGDSFHDGFDVRGIVMLQGDYGFPNMGYTTTRAATGGWALLNPDGYTTIFNAQDYTLPGIRGYSRGKMIPPSWPVPTNTLNAFRAFYSPGQSEDDGGRRGFQSGDEIQRVYQIQTVSAQPIRFWYAVDASWVPPTGPEPYDFDDFPTSANCPEAYRFDFSVVSGELNPTGGSIKIGVAIWDHQGWQPPYQLNVEAPECSNAGMVTTEPPIWISGDRAYWEFTIPNDLGGLDPALGAELLVVANNNDDDPLTGPIQAAGRFTMPVTPASGKPVVYSIDPNFGIQGGGVDNAHIIGDKFQPGCIARLAKSGEPDVVATDFVYQDSQNVLGDFNLTGAALGKWDVVVENFAPGMGVLPEGFLVLPPSECNKALHENYLGAGDFGGGTNMPASDDCFVHNTGTDADGELMGYISGFAGTVVTTYMVDTTTPSNGHGFTGGGWGNPHILSWPVPNSIDIAEESGRFFIAWSDTPSIVEVWAYDGKLKGETDASNNGTVYCLDTDGHGGFWDGYFPEYGFAPGIKHFTPDGPDPGTLVEEPADAFTLPETWGTPFEIVCIPDDTILILTGSNGGTISAYYISVSPSEYKGSIDHIFSGDLDFGGKQSKPCDMEADWSDPAYAHCRIIVWGNLASGGGELVRIDTDLNILAGPVSVPGHYESMTINPHTLGVTLWPERGGSGGSYALVEVPPGW
jgi:hypothetical protein